MKYIVRVLKYFVYVTIIMALILWVLTLLKVVDGDPQVMFRNGYKSLWQIALMFLAVSAVYPRFGFTKRGVRVYGDPAETRPGIISLMEERGYRLEQVSASADGPAGTMRFVLRSPLRRALKMWEDRITLTPELPGYTMEGITKDVIRLAATLEYRLGPDGSLHNYN